MKLEKRLDELYKIELVEKVRSERGTKSNDELIALLSPRSKKNKNHRKAKSAAVTKHEKETTKLPALHFDEKNKRIYYEVCLLIVLKV